MNTEHDTFTASPFPRIRLPMVDGGRMGRQRHTVHGLVEFDVTQARQAIREHKARTGEALSFTAFIVACLVKWQDGEVAAALMTGKRAALLVTCGGDAEDNADLIQVMFDREIAYLRGTVVGKYVVANCTTPAELRERAAETARRMAAETRQPR